MKLEGSALVGLAEVAPKFRSSSVVVLSGGRKHGGRNNRRSRRKDISRSSRWIKLYAEV